MIDLRLKCLCSEPSSEHRSIRPPGHLRSTVSFLFGRSGSSVGANYAESRAAESTKDFIHKLSIALKEAEETDFWLGCLAMEYPQFSEAEALRTENHEFVKILQSSITTTKRNLSA